MEDRTSTLASTNTVSATAQTAQLPIEDRPTLEELGRRYIDFILRETGGNKKWAAEILGIDRRTLNRPLERAGMHVAQRR